LSIKQISSAKDLKNKRIILRLDLNESVDKSGKLLDDFRIKAALPTIQSLLGHGNKLIIISHLGRPDGKRTAELSLEPIAKCLAECLDYKYVKTSEQLPTYAVPHLILFTGDITNQVTRQQLSNQSAHDIVLLENIRFYKQEDKNDLEFAKQLAELGDVYVNDAFSVAHRAESSTEAITELLPSFAGPLLATEISALDPLVTGRVKQPFVLLMGGIKIGDKSRTLMNLGKHADKILLAGGLANLFLHARGYDVGIDQLDKADIGLAKQVMLNFQSKIVLPSDVVTYSSHQRTGSKILVKQLPEIVGSDKIYDIGPQTILEFSRILQTAGTICWNGPLGFFEEKSYRAGTMAIVKVIGGLGNRRAYTVAGGGETVAAIRQAGQFEHFDHVSTGGGAMLEYLAGVKLSGVEALQKSS
jgi:phosphoglycerate kinase